MPDYVSVNLSKPRTEQVIAALTERGVGLEAGIWTPADARYLMLTSAKIMANATWVRLLLEPWETNPAHAHANVVVDQLEAVLKNALLHVSRLLHGTDAAVWSMLARAVSGYASRVGLEDTPKLPMGEAAPDNVALVRAAKTLS